MINVVIVDDMPYFLEDIQKELKDFFVSCDYSYKIYTFTEYNDDFFKLISQNLENVLCLFDIETKEENGIDVARKIRQYNQELDILFLTAHNNEHYRYAILTSNIKSIGFICKKNIKKEFPGKMREFLNSIKTKELICFRDSGYDYSLSIKDIYYVTTNKYTKKTVIKTVNGLISVSLPLKELEGILMNKSKYFVKVHRSFIINIYRAISLNISKKLIIFTDTDKVTSISRKYKDHLLELWEEFHTFTNS